MEQLDVDIVPYIVLLVVPVLGRMSDPSDSIRFMATQCFATLIRLLPLEVGESLLNHSLATLITRSHYPVFSLLSTRQVYQTLQPCPLT